MSCRMVPRLLPPYRFRLATTPTSARSRRAFNSKDHYYEDTAYFTLSANATQAKANNSYGSGQTCSRIYSLSYYYGK